MEVAIEINRIKWRVFIVDSTHEELTDEDGEQDAYGITQLRKCEIYIDGGLAAPIYKQILIHELVHAMAFSYRTDLEGASEEVICDFIAAHFDELKSLCKSVLNCKSVLKSI